MYKMLNQQLTGSLLVKSVKQGLSLFNVQIPLYGVKTTGPYKED